MKKLILNLEFFQLNCFAKPNINCKDIFPVLTYCYEYIHAMLFM